VSDSVAIEIESRCGFANHW